MNVLALDLGTRTGWAIKRETSKQVEDSYEATTYTVISGTWALSDPKAIKQARAEGWDRKCDPRFNALCLHIEEAVEECQIKAVVFEDILFGSTSMQAHLWATFRAAIWAVKRKHDFEVDCLNSATLKKYATGHGNATKQMMAAHLMVDPRSGGLYIKNPKPTASCFLLKKTGEKVDENETDAIHLLRYFSYL